MNSENTCDLCEAEYDTRYYVTTPRPSVPTELVSILYICPDCAKEHSLFTGEQPARTYIQLQEYFDSGEARKDGLLWMSV